MILAMDKMIGMGFCSTVFESGNLAYKLFKRGPNVPPRHTEEGRRKTFASQCQAYALAARDGFLRDHVASFYGTCGIEDVIDIDGCSLRQDYLLDCCYVLEVLNGDPVTHPTLSSPVDHLRDAVSRFARIGIDVHDADVFFAEDRQRFKFVDFEMEHWFAVDVIAPPVSDSTDNE